MIRKLIERAWTSRQNEGTALVVTGMAGLLSGQKLPSIFAFGRGAYALERAWREAHPEFDGDFSDRWRAAIAYFDATHQHPTNRALHVVGIPMIVAGAAGLLLAGPGGPIWLAAAGSFSLGWALNIAGHALFEKNAPAFADDPLAFIAGPAWDLRQVWRRVAGRRGAQLAAAAA